MGKFFKRLRNFVLTVCVLSAFGYFVIMPKLLPTTYKTEVERFSTLYQVDEALVYAVIYCESGFDKDAVSSANAMGLMQVTQDTGWWAASQIDFLDADNLDLFDPETNIALGCWYLRWLSDKFDGKDATVLAGYNAGHGNVAKWLADETKSADGISLDEIPFSETALYVKKVQIMRKLYEICYRM